MKAPDFLMDKKEEGIETLDLNTLQGMIESYDGYADDVARAEKYLKLCKENFNRMALEIIPQFLLSNGITQMRLTDGREINIKEDISATIKDETAFRQWLKDRNEDDIVKVNYKFGKMESSALHALSDYLAYNDYDYEINAAVHPQTKKKYFKELIKEIGQEELPEWVSIYNIRKVVVK